MSIKKVKKQIKEAWFQYEKAIILTVAFILVAITSVEIGILQGQKWQQTPLIIEKPVIITGQLTEKKLDNQNDKNRNNAEIFNEKINDEKCVFIGSIKSNKYHKKDCRWAGQIKPINIICFKSEEIARKSGYVPASCLKK